MFQDRGLVLANLLMNLFTTLKGGGFISQLRIYQFLKMASAP